MRVAFLLLGAVVAGAAGAEGGASERAEIAFVSIRTGDPQIFIRDRTGHVRAVTQGKGLYAQPALSSTQRLAYAARVGATTRVYVTDAQRAAPERLTQDERTEFAPSWSPEGGALAYYSMPIEGGTVELRLVNLATRVTEVLARSPYGMGPTPASWSADGSRLAFLAIDAKQRGQVWIVQRDGGGLREISSRHTPRGGGWPEISPDGRTVLWVADMRGRLPIVATDVESGESRELTPEPDARYEAARWSPDGHRIAFASARDSGELRRNDIFIMNADGSGARNVSRHPAEDFDPRWSADGRSIVFASLRTGTSLLYEVSLDADVTRPVSLHPSHDMHHVMQPVSASQRSLSAVPPT